MRKSEVAKWDEETEVLVAGYGFAGAVASIETYDSGTEVLLVEKETHPAGCSPAAGGNMTFVTDVEKAFEYFKTAGGGRTPDDVIRTFCEEASLIPDYVKKLVEVDGAEFVIRDSDERGWGVFDLPGREGRALLNIAKVPGFTNFDWYPANPPGGVRLMKVLMDNMEARKVPVNFSTPVRELVQDEHTGEIVGVIAESGGKKVSIKCKKAVILACGGFEQNDEMRKNFTQGISWTSMCHTSNTGDGIRMTQKVGAGLWHMWHIHGSYGFWFPELGKIGIRHGFGGGAGGRYGRERQMPWIIVDKRGKRYMNEVMPMPQDLNHRAMQLFEGNLWLSPHYKKGANGYPRIPSWLIFDDEGIKLGPLATTGLSWSTYMWSRDNSEEIKKGWIIQSDTIKGLAAKIKSDPQNDELMNADFLESTVKRWNEIVEAGEIDPDFLRGPKSFFKPIAKPPFYAIKAWPLINNTQGGPVHNARQQVLDSFGEVIPRLYAIGELGSMFGHVYETEGNMCECFTSGRIAARNATGEKPWD